MPAETMFPLSRTRPHAAAAVRHGPAHCRRKREGATQFPTIGLFERNANNFKGTRNTKAQKSWSSRAEPEVRIHLPPGKSPVRTSSNQPRNQISADDPSAGSSVYAKAKVVDGRAGRPNADGRGPQSHARKNWPIRALVRVAPGPRYQPTEFERETGAAYRGRDVECAVFFECCLAV